MKKIIPLLMLCIAPFSFATEKKEEEQRFFDIEIIVFKHLVDIEETNEHWPDNQAVINTNNAYTFEDDEYLEEKEVSLLDDETLHLLNQAKAIDENEELELLIHTSWRQDDKNKEESPIFHLQAGADYSLNFHSDGQLRENADKLSTFFKNSPDEMGRISSPLYELDGKLQIYVQRYLYADIDIVLKKPSIRKIIFHDVLLDDIIQNEEFLKNYRMKQIRLIRSSETHYIDHPLLGIIIQIRKVSDVTNTLENSNEQSSVTDLLN